MNERIRQLAEQAGFDDRGSNHTAYMNFDHEKFAELIVRECIACSTWVGMMNTNSVEPVHTAHAVNQRIKQQFGVEYVA
jgi:hypothetical protein